MNGVKDILKSFGNAMAASSFAEEGEFDAAREILSQGKTGSKKVVLGVATREINARALDYAIGLSRRTGAAMEILQLLPPAGDPNGSAHGTLTGNNRTLADIQGDLKGGHIIYRAIPWDGRMIEGLLKLLQDRRDILCLVLGQSVSGMKRRIAMLDRLGCPVVIPEETAA